MAIQSFRDKDAETIFSGRMPGKGFPASLVRAAQRKLAILDAAVTLDDLKAPAGNGLHALKEDRSGQLAIKVNNQYRICFVWTEAGPADVEITDYH